MTWVRWKFCGLKAQLRAGWEAGAAAGMVSPIFFAEESKGISINDLEEISLDFHGWTAKNSSSKIQIENPFSRQLKHVSERWLNSEKKGFMEERFFCLLWMLLQILMYPCFPSVVLFLRISLQSFPPSSTSVNFLDIIYWCVWTRALGFTL